MLGVKAPEQSRTDEKLQALEQQILDEFYKDLLTIGQKSEERLRGYFASKVMAKGSGLSASQRAALIDQLLAEVIGLSALEPYLSMPEIEAIRVTEEGKIWVGKGDEFKEAERHFKHRDHLRLILDRLAQNIELALQAGHFSDTGEKGRQLTLTIPFSLDSFVKRGVIGPSTAAFLEAFSVPEEKEELTLELGRLLFLYQAKA